MSQGQTFIRCGNANTLDNMMYNSVSRQRTTRRDVAHHQGHVEDKRQSKPHHTNNDAAVCGAAW